MKVRELEGARLGKQIVLERSPKNSCGRTCWKVKCDCGSIRIVQESDLIKKNGIKACCFCTNRKHGFSYKEKRHYLFNVWCDIRKRCFNKKCLAYKNYGGRGITVSKKWFEFLPFKKYVEDTLGSKPCRKTLDRINNNLGYFPGNLRWATSRQQGRNKRNNSKFRRIDELQNFKEYNCLAEAEDEGFLGSKIRLCLNKERKTHAGFRWERIPNAC